jgi:hypothetical protein
VVGNALIAGGAVARTPRYSWAWMCQQTKVDTINNPTPSGVSLTVGVYDRRPLVPGPASPLLEEAPVMFSSSAGTNLATVQWSPAATPVLKRGCWILDASPTHGYFYRVVNVIMTGPTSAQIELHANARAAATPSAGNNAVIIDSVVEVFEKGQ